MYEISVYLITPDLGRWEIQPLANVPSGPFLSGPVHSAQEPGPDWALAALLIGAVSVLLILGRIDGRSNPNERAALGTWLVVKSAPRGHLQDGFQTRT